MFNIHQSRLSATLLTLGCILFACASATAGDAKPPILSKVAVLNADDEKDTKLTSSPSRNYSVKLIAGKTYQIDLKSKDFDSYLRLLDDAGKEVAEDDDGGGYPNAQITYKASKTAEYKVIVTSFPDKTGKFAAFGKFTLTVAEVDPPVGNSRFQAKAIALTLKDGKASDTNALGDKDKAMQGHRFKVYTVDLEKGKTYRFENHDAGDKINPFLILEDGDGNQLEAGGGAGDASITFKAAKAGSYRLVATTANPGPTGKFVLEVAPETDKKLLQEADLKFRINSFASLKAAERKGLVGEISKRLLDKDGDLTIIDARLAMQLGNEAESEDIDLARAVYKEAIKQFAAAKDEKITGVTTEFERALKNLDKLGKIITISGKTTTGKEFDLKNLKGKVVLVDFWGTWCGPCVQEMPNVLRAYQKYHKRGFDVIGVARDKSDAIVTKFMEARQLPWLCINIEDSAKLIEMHEVNSYPTVMLVDQSGRVVSLRARGPQLERLLERLLAEKK